MPRYNISSKKPFEVLNITGYFKNSPNEVLIFGSYEDEESIGNTRLEVDSFYGDDIISERGIWSAAACISGYRNKKRKYKDYGVIMQTLPIRRNMECYMEDQVKSHGPYYLCNPLMSDLVLAIVPWGAARETLHGLALKEASDFLGKGQMRTHAGGRCDKGAHYYHERHLGIKMVRDIISGETYSDGHELLQIGYNKTRLSP